MPRECEGYRENLEALRQYFGPNHNLLKPTDVARFCGCCPRTAVKRFDIPKGGIMLTILARRMCK